MKITFKSIKIYLKAILVNKNVFHNNFEYDKISFNYLKTTPKYTLK